MVPNGILQKNRFFVDRRIEVLSHALKASPQIIINQLSANIQDFELRDVAKSIVSEAIGMVFGRWSTKKVHSNLRQPFDTLPNVAPAGLETLSEGYDAPSVICASGVIPVEANSQHDLCASIRSVLDVINGSHAEALLDECLTLLNSRPLSLYLTSANGYFSDHLSRYSKSRRQAPIYWPLQTSLTSYTLWIYYHRLNEQTLYKCVNDYVEPKLEAVKEDLDGLRSKSSRNTQEEEELAQLTDLTNELRNFRDELLRLAKFWKPNLNDGVQITAAPLWKLFQHKAWQKKLKETWGKLERGDYDWAHLACSIWPERVLRKCHQDRSLAIAHDVEDLFWREVEVPVKRGKKATGGTKLEWQPKELTDAELNALIQVKSKEVNA